MPINRALETTYPTRREDRTRAATWPETRGVDTSPSSLTQQTRGVSGSPSGDSRHARGEGRKQNAAIALLRAATTDERIDAWLRADDRRCARRGDVARVEVNCPRRQPPSTRG